MKVLEVLTPQGKTRYVLVSNNSELVKPVNRFLKYLDNIGRARNTLRAYCYDQKLFWSFLQEKGLDYTSITLDDMATFVMWMKSPALTRQDVLLLPQPQARSATTINRVLTSISHFYDYCWRQSDININMRECTHALRQMTRSYRSFLTHVEKSRRRQVNILKQRIAKHRPQTLTPSQVSALIAACSNQRDRLLLTLIWNSGLRIGEVLALWIEDVDFANCQLHVRDRGELVNRAEIKTPASVRSVIVETDLLNQISDYMARCHTDEIATNHLFFTLRGARKGEPLCVPAIYDLLKRLERITGIHAWPHLLRHTYLTELAEAGLRPELLQAIAGHEHFNTTFDMYVHPSDADMRASWEAASQRLKARRAEKEKIE